MVVFAWDALRFRLRRVLGGIDNQAYFDQGIGAILNCLDVSSAETQRQRVPIGFEKSTDISAVVHVAFRHLPLRAQLCGYFRIGHRVEFSHMCHASFLFPGSTKRDTFTGAGQPVERDLGHTVIPDLQSNRHESLYYGLTRFPKQFSWIVVHRRGMKPVDKSITLSLTSK